MPGDSASPQAAPADANAQVANKWDFLLATTKHSRFRLTCEMVGPADDFLSDIDVENRLLFMASRLRNVRPFADNDWIVCLEKTQTRDSLFGDFLLLPGWLGRRILLEAAKAQLGRPPSTDLFVCSHKLDFAAKLGRSGRDPHRFALGRLPTPLLESMRPFTRRKFFTSVSLKQLSETRTWAQVKGDPLYRRLDALPDEESPHGPGVFMWLREQPVQAPENRGDAPEAPEEAPGECPQEV